MGLLDTIIGTDGGLLDRPVSAPANVQRAKFGDRLNNWLQSDGATGLIAGLLSGGDTWDSIAKGYTGYQAGKDAQKKKDQWNDFLFQKQKAGDISMPDYSLLKDNPQFGSDYGAQILSPASTADIRNFHEAQKGGFKGSFTDWMAQSNGGTDKLSMSPLWFKDANGNWQIGQLSNQGGIVQAQIPEGLTPQPGGVSWQDLGTSRVATDRGGAPIASMPVDNVGVAADKAAGTAQGEARASLPAARQTAALVTRQIDDLLSDPGLGGMTGPWDGRMPNVSGSANALQAKIDQVKSQAFLQGYQLLKGGGAITEVEGRKAEDAMVRLSQTQDDASFRQALTDFRDAVQDGVAKLETQAAGGGQLMQPQAPQQPAQQPGQIQIMKPMTLPNGVTVEQVQ